MSQSSEKQLRVYQGSSWTGIAQLSLVEHSLSPLKGTTESFVHETEYLFFPEGRPETARVKVSCPMGFQPQKDELVLWGMLALACRGGENEIAASGRFLLGELGLSKSGKEMVALRQSIYRLGQVSYFNEKFYDPIRQEHRAVGFGLLSHDMPIGEQSYRPWRIAIDPIFFDYCRAERGYLGFDLQLYRKLRPSARRMFHKLRKVLHKRTKSQAFDVKHFAINVLGCSPERPQKKFNESVSKAARELIDAKVLSHFAMIKVRKGQYSVTFYRAAKAANHKDQSYTAASQSNPLNDLLSRIGLSQKRIENVMEQYPDKLVARWADITLCRMEKGMQFGKSPGAFFNHYLQLASEGKATDPDWYRKQRNLEQNACDRELGKRLGISAARKNDKNGQEFNSFLRSNQSVFERVLNELLESNSMCMSDASKRAENIMRKRFDAKNLKCRERRIPNKAGDIIDLNSIRKMGI